ncbi:hypothetical protein [Saccharomonospora iraqiensis]|uniref:hypothetical protein n=1 Tax=Saccharomonospora iraqiensis TaxID=52698 RepID=UPI0003FEBDC3|nr:hypothetical protein [Saccharomonospora iraqiensis]
MDQSSPAPDRHPGEHLGILAVDVRHFSRHTTAQQETIQRELPAVLRAAADRVGLAEAWRGHRFHAFRGDGYLVGVRPELVAAVVDGFFDALQVELRRRVKGFRASGIELRLRTSLHYGPVGAFDALLADSPAGRVMVDAGRMLDAEPVRRLLDHSDPEVTLVASVLSGTVMEEIVRAERTERRPSEFVEAPLELAAKEYSGTGYLRVPAPSGDLLRAVLLPGGDDTDTPEEAGAADAGSGPAPVSNTVTGDAHGVAQSGVVHGGVRQHTVGDASGSGIVVSGDGHVTAGRDVTQSSTEITGDVSTRGDANFGPASGRRTGGTADRAGW